MKKEIFTIVILVLISVTAFGQAIAKTDTNELQSMKIGLLDIDTDGDEIPDCNDNCPYVYNPDQNDSDGTSIQSFVSYWRFDEGDGTIAYDSVGTNHGTLINGPVWTIGKVGGALSFDGVNDYVEVADSNSLDLESPFTLEAWVKPNVKTHGDRWMDILEKRNYFPSKGSAQANYEFDITPSGRPWFSVGDGNCSTSLTAPESVIFVSWNHISCVYNGSLLNIYLNGVLVASGKGIWNYAGYLIDPNGIVIPKGNEDTLIIGALKGRPDMECFDGSIDEVAIYNRVLTPGEICQHYRNGLIEHDYTSGDGWGDICDNCPDVYNLSQTDSDGDGIGNACDEDCPNLDGLNPVNFIDFSILAEDWQLTGPSFPGDLNKNGSVDINDLGIFAIYWLSCCYECCL